MLKILTSTAMKIYRKFKMTLVVPICITLLVTSCKDKFTEEDLLNAQQTIDYSVVLKDVATLLGIEGATVSIVQNGVELTATTNALGVATFERISIGNGFPLTITATDYATINSNVFIFADYRQAEETEFFYTLSQTNELATVRGIVEIETDVTNQVREVLGSADVRAVFVPSSYNNLDLFNINFTITATTAADGTYSMDLPTFGDGVEYNIFVNDIEVAQTIAYSREQGQPLFPATLPQVADIPTVFSSSSPNDIPSISTSGFVPSVFATVNATPSGAGAQAAVFDVGGISAAGAITFIGINNAGLGYAASTTVPVTITSLFGGSGAVITANTGAGGQILSFNITNGGTGYPAGNPDANFNFATSSQNLSRSNELVRPGDIRVIDIYYGTGTSRTLDIL